MSIHNLEIAQLNQLGVISRPFSPQLKAQPSGFDRIKEAYYSIKAQEVVAEVIGADFSYWQGDVNWQIAKDNGLQFAILRAGYGNSYIDNKLANNRTGCQTQQLPFGLYWYAVPNLSAVSHAATFARVWKEGGGVIYPVVDLEETGGLTKAALETWLKTMLAEFARLTGYGKLMIYSSTSFLNTYLPVSAWMYSFPLWQAAWTTNTNPPLPIAWKNRRFHQYSATGDGKYYGAQSTYLDMNRYNGTWSEFEKEFGLSPVPPQPTPSPAPEGFTMEVIATVLNVRNGPGTNYADVGDLPKGTVFEVSNVAGSSAWVQIKGGSFDGKWVCVQLNTTRFCEPSQN